jgi:hypothetical protein
MTLTNNQKIMVFGILTGALVTIWTTTYMFSPDLVHSEITPPNVISSKPEGDSLYFSLTNYGEKKGSYGLYLKSEDILFSRSKSYDLNDYQYNIELSYVLPPKDNVQYFFYFMANESNLKPNVTVTFNYIDKSHLLNKEKKIDFYYELDNSDKYLLKSKSLK